MSQVKRSRQEWKSSRKPEVRYVDGLVHLNDHAAGIDVGSKEHWVCVPADSCAPEQRVRKFGAFTCNLVAIADWLKACGVTTVAMESTGVYWIPLYQVLEAAGLAVWLVNARYVKRVPGRPKTDPLDCQWIQRLHTYGLLRRSFRPTGDICAVRALWRHRDCLIEEWTRAVQHIQKALHEMNVLLHKVVTDITGKTGMAILAAIVGGERDPERLASFRDPRIKASKEDIVEALRGNYRDELVLITKLSLERLQSVQGQIQSLDQNIEQRLGRLEPNPTRIGEPDLLDSVLKRNTHQHAPEFDAVHLVQHLYGVPLADIPGLNATTLMGILAEVGLDLSAWENAKHFTAWLTLSPRARVSGGKVIGACSTAKTGNRAGRYFRQAASSLKHSDVPLGDFFRRMRARKGTKHAITATARKLAEIFYLMVTTGSSYRYMDRNQYDEKQRNWQIRHLRRRAAKFGYELKEKVA